MAINKIIYGSSTLIDLTGDDVTAADVASGKIFHLPSGVQAVGTASGASINIANYSVLPATGVRNQIALINDTAINDVYIQPKEPDSPSEGDVWIMAGWSGNVYLQFDVAKIYLTTCRQYVSGAWTVIPEWYVYTTAWTRARLYLIQNGVFTGAQTFTTRKWKQESGSTTPSGTTQLTQNSDHVYITHTNTSTTTGEHASAGMCTPNFNAGQYSQIYIDMTSRSSYQSCERYLAIAKHSDSYVKFNPYAYKNLTTATTETREQYTVDITQTDEPCCLYFGMNVRNNSNIAWAKIYTLYLE